MPHGLLHVVAHSAHDLPTADVSYSGHKSSDPFCVLELARQSHQTRTIYEDVNPTWGDAFSFQLELPRSFTEPSAQVQPPLSLKVSVWDEDKWSAHDPLGNVTVDVGPFLKTPLVWHTQELHLLQSSARHQKGTIVLLLYWEPLPMLPPFFRRLFGVVSYSIAGALFLVASTCRWERRGDEVTDAKQPGVAVAMCLASVCSLGGCALHFVLAHLPRTASELELLEHHTASSKLSEALATCQSVRIPGQGGRAQDTDGLVSLRVKTLSLTNYEISVTPHVDLRLPATLLAWLLPLAAKGLAGLAFALQLQGSGSLALEAGEMCNGAGLGCLVGGFAFLFFASFQPSSKKISETAMQNGKRPVRLELPASSVGPTPVVRHEGGIFTRNRDRLMAKLRDS
mmetsp:Transcript_26657/g.58584  ORF Transcript_26657/g.58584 Transcript_26657/m.58584 type:complete len:397 (-) Transcript_26657:282-1472(-)